MGRLDGKIAIITGAAGGQGAAEARALASEGANVLVTDVAPGIGKVAASIGGAAAACELDVTDEDAWHHAVATAEEAFGPVTVLINNAGLLRRGALREFDVQAARAIGTALGMKVVSGSMERANGGSIVNVSSAGGMSGYPYSGAYCASKWAVRGLTRVAALELADLGVRVNSIHPGFVDTDMVGADADFAALAGRIAARHPVPRLGRPDEIANLVVYLAGDESGYCTGGEFVIDGGELAGDVPGR